MICKCGAEMNDSRHVVKTLDKAKEWYPEVKAHDLPIVVHYSKCPACGRIHKLIWRTE